MNYKVKKYDSNHEISNKKILILSYLLKQKASLNYNIYIYELAYYKWYTYMIKHQQRLFDAKAGIYELSDILKGYFLQFIIRLNIY